MDEGRWLIINLSEGHLRENTCLLGGLLMGRLKVAIMSRVDIPEAERIPFSLYVDEFQAFAPEDFQSLLSEARKYGLGLILAHQNSGPTRSFPSVLDLGQCGHPDLFPSESPGRQLPLGRVRSQRKKT